MNLSKQIVNLRKREHISQEELAEKIYVSRQTVSNWEREKSYPDIHSLLLLSVYFDVSLDYLIKGDLEMMQNTRDIRKYKRIASIRNILAVISIFLMIIGRNIYGDSFSIFMGLLGLGVIISSSLALRKIERKNNIKNNLFNPKEAEDILLFLENPSLTEEEFEEKRKKEKKKRFFKWAIQIFAFMLFVFLSACVSQLLA